MRSALYKYFKIGTKTNKPNEIKLLVVDRREKRGFQIHEKWINHFSTHFRVQQQYFVISLESTNQLPIYGTLILS